MIYWVLATLCLVLPWIRRYGLLPLIVLLLGLPVGNALSLYFYKGGLFFFDFYFLSLFLRLLTEQRLAGKWAMFGAVMVILWALISLAGGVQPDFYFIRDFRLVLYLGTLICLTSLQHRSNMFTGRTLKWLAVLSGTSCLVYALMTAAGLFQFNDEFYVQNSFRYFAISSYFSFGFFAFNSFLPAKERRGTLYFIALMASMLGIVLTGLRAISFVALMLFAIGLMKSRRGIVLMVSLLFIGAPLVLFTQTSADEGPSAVSRLSEISPEIVFHQLQSRFLPFFLEFQKFRLIEVWLGGGFGQTFEIPWFAHREAKDNVNNFVDSTYLTLYAKFGVFAPLLLITYAFSYSRLLYPKGRGMVFLVAIGLSVLWMVYSMPYQMTSVGLALLMFLIGSTNRSPDPGNRASNENASP